MRTVDEYLSLPYTKVIRRDAEGDVVASVEELPGCTAHGKTDEEALTNLLDMQSAWIEETLAANQPVPEPSPDEGIASGRWLQRVPRTLHAKLKRVARREGVSLNQLVTSLLAEAVGRKTTSRDWGTLKHLHGAWVWGGHQLSKSQFVILQSPETSSHLSKYLAEYRRRLPDASHLHEPSFREKKHARKER